MLFPPSTDRKLIGLDEGEQSIFWYLHRYEKLVRNDPLNLGIVEVLQVSSIRRVLLFFSRNLFLTYWRRQKPGETVYIPGGWPHVVINMELSVAVTHNYAADHLLEEIWTALCEEGETDFALRWYNGLKRNNKQALIDRIDKTGIEAKQ